MIAVTGQPTSSAVGTQAGWAGLGWAELGWAGLPSCQVCLGVMSSVVQVWELDADHSRGRDASRPGVNGAAGRSAATEKVGTGRTAELYLFTTSF